MNDVQYALICTGSNSGTGGCGATAGTVGTWNITAPFAAARDKHEAVVYDGYIYIMGGYNVGTKWNTTQRAPIGPNGALGDWSTAANAFTAVRYSFGIAAYNGYFYITGGSHSGNSDTTCNATASLYCSDVQYAPINTIERSGNYSKLVDLGQSSTVYSITYNGTLANGTAAINYKAWDGNGTTLISSGGASSITGSGTTCRDGILSRYVWVNIAMDDSGDTAIFPDTLATNYNNVQDFTINYTAVTHPAPNIRLRHNQTLQAGVLSPLDTCGV
jgi:hypothetical protein